MNISPDIFQMHPTVAIIRSSSRWWGGSDMRSILESIPSALANRDRGCGCARRQRYRSFSHPHRPMGIVRNSNLLLQEPATDLVLSGRKRARLTGLFLPGCIVRCKHDGTHSATGAHHAGPSPLARYGLPPQLGCFVSPANVPLSGGRGGSC
jgi:hypothetical protein